MLYVGGRPNWEFKFLRRAVDEDDEVHLVGLVRIAKREPKFTFLGRSGERTNPLFRGFGNQSDEEAEQYDEPVLVRLGTEDKEELRGGFPQGRRGPVPLSRDHPRRHRGRLLHAGPAVAAAAVRQPARRRPA